MNAGRNLTADLVTHIRSITFESVPPEIVEMAKQCLLDWLGVAIAGQEAPSCRILGTELGQVNAGNASAIGLRSKVPAQIAALMNGTAGHVLDYDDVHMGMVGHPSAVVIPVVFALSEGLSLGGRPAIAAVVAGFETAGLVGSLVNPRHYDSGWHATGTIGTLAAATSAGHLMSLSTSEWAHCFAISASQAAGLQSTFGTMTKSLQAGKAAANGLLAAQLAKRGFTGSSEGSEDTLRLLPFSAQGNELQLDSGFMIAQTQFKFYASCFLSHPMLQAASKIATELLDPGEIDSVECYVSERTANVCHFTEPRTDLETKFSLVALAAMALSKIDTSDPRTFSGYSSFAQSIDSLRRRIVVVPSREETDVSSRVSVRTREGQLIEESASLDRLIPSERWDALTRKFSVLTEPYWSNQAIDETIETVKRLSEVDNMARQIEMWLGS